MTGLTDVQAFIRTATLDIGDSLECVESPAGSGQYVPVPFSSPAVAATYSGVFEDANGNALGTIDAFYTDSSGNLIPDVTFAAAAQAIGAQVPTAGTISIVRGDSVSVQITGLGSLVGMTKLYLTAKNAISYATDPDAASMLQVEVTAGLLTVAGSPYGASTDGSLTINDSSVGNVTLALKPPASGLLVTTRNTINYVYDVQLEVGSTVTTKAFSGFVILADVTKSV